MLDNLNRYSSDEAITSFDRHQSTKIRRLNDLFYFFWIEEAYFGKKRVL
jgi:hypothetical protein